jgi:L-ascorbate metabolism protein UlaG (beta-lactamase superfamily)
MRAAIFLLALLPVAAMAQTRLPSLCNTLSMANPALIPAAFGDPLLPDTVRIHYLDHATFLIATPGGLVAATDFTGLTGMGALAPDIVTMNNAHISHYATRPDPRIRYVLKGWVQDGRPADYTLDLGEMLVRNVTTDRRPRLGEADGEEANSIFIFEVAGLCIGHLSHLHIIPTEEDFAAIGRLDVVMVPVDDGATLRVGDAAAVVRRLHARVVIPMHWFSEPSREEFIADLAPDYQVLRLDDPDIVLSRDNLPGQPTIIVLPPAFLE